MEHKFRVCVSSLTYLMTENLRVHQVKMYLSVFLVANGFQAKMLNMPTVAKMYLKFAFTISIIGVHFKNFTLGKKLQNLTRNFEIRIYTLMITKMLPLNKEKILFRNFGTIFYVM